MVSMVLLTAFYGLLLCAAVLRPKNIIYFLAFFSPFDTLFSPVFLKISLWHIQFTLKPFLFLTFILMFFCAQKWFEGRRVPIHAACAQKVYTGLLVFCLVSLVSTLAQRTGYLTEVNIMINASLIFLLPYFYQDEKIRLDRLFAVFSAALLLVVAHCAINIWVLGVWNNQAAANYLLMLLPLMLFGFSTYHGKKSLLFALTSVLVYTTIYFTLSRCSWIAALLCVMCYLFYMIAAQAGRNARSAKKTTFIAAIFLVIPAVLASSVLAIHDEAMIFWTFFEQANRSILRDPALRLTDNPFLIHLYYALGHQRTIAWRETMHLFSLNPFFGYGLNFELSQVGMHSSLFKVLLASGALGTFFFFGSVLMLFRRLVRVFSIFKSRQVSLFFLALLCSVATWQIRGLTDTVLNEYVVWIVASLCFFIPRNLDYKP